MAQIIVADDDVSLELGITLQEEGFEIGYELRRVEVDDTARESPHIVVFEPSPPVTKGKWIWRKLFPQPSKLVGIIDLSDPLNWDVMYFGYNPRRLAKTLEEFVSSNVEVTFRRLSMRNIESGDFHPLHDHKTKLNIY